MLDTWSTVLRGSVNDLWLGVAEFVPKLLAALVIFIIGWIIGAILGRVVEQIIKALRVDSALRSVRLEEVLKRAGFDLNSGAFLGELVKWFVIIAFLVASFEILGLRDVNIFLQEVVLSYLPRVIVAVLILLGAALIAEAMQRIVTGASQAAGITAANFLGVVTRWSIWIFAILMALFELRIAAPFIQTLFTGIIVAIALAFGLAFGLGGQDAAGKFVERVRGEIASRHNR